MVSFGKCPVHSEKKPAKHTLGMTLEDRGGPRLAAIRKLTMVKINFSKGQCGITANVKDALRAAMTNKSSRKKKLLHTKLLYSGGPAAVEQSKKRPGEVTK